MTDNDYNANEQSGEIRYKAKRRAFVRYLAITCMIALVLGYFSGYFTGRFKDGEIHVALPIAALGAVLAFLAWFTVDYFRRVDELDLMDNLWAHLIGQYGALFLFMGWYFLAELNVVSAYPTAIAVILAMIATTFIAYGLRKLGWR